MKPNAPIVAFVTNHHTACKLDFCAGVLPIVIDKSFDKQEDLEVYISNILKSEKFADIGDRVVVVFGRNTKETKVLFKKGTTNIMAVMSVI